MCKPTPTPVRNWGRSSGERSNSGSQRGRRAVAPRSVPCDANSLKKSGRGTAPVSAGSIQPDSWRRLLEIRSKSLGRVGSAPLGAHGGRGEVCEATPQQQGGAASRIFPSVARRPNPRPPAASEPLVPHNLDDTANYLGQGRSRGRRAAESPCWRPADHRIGGGRHSPFTIREAQQHRYWVHSRHSLTSRAICPTRHDGHPTRGRSS
jgi:hypothetical protein